MIIRNGFYSALVKPKLRIISINNNFCVRIVVIVIVIVNLPSASSSAS